ncbi:SDR family oxidoreductase [Streptomyces pathocidini]|uniref:SDR family NAD(P)-dependent oxidoreductase n=1 Tax=Streptomyces pathocidini TaxID=1650571 RepID=UPI0034027F74
MGTLNGKTALVTGSSRGIGRGIAMRLAQDGARVAVHYGRSEAAAKETVAAIEADGGQAFAIGAELGVDGDAERLFAAYDEHADSLDILVNNAGRTMKKPLEDLSREDFRSVFALNVEAPFFVAKEALKRMPDGGRIINISSFVARVAFPASVAYPSTKAAVDNFTRSLAKGLGPRGITVNAVAPGYTQTDMVDAVLADPEARAFAEAASAFNRLGTVEEVADVVAFVASDAARWITGQVIEASGGVQL